jgi:hypothetical protein
MYTWREALQDAVAHLGATEQTYSMYEVGGDVYVFYAPRGAESGIQNVVKLANTNAAYNVIDYTSFIPDLGVTREGDGSANAMTGTSLRDFLDGKGGDDVINGGRGNDTLTGGAGADVFKFVAGDGLFNPKLQDFDTVTDFGAGDKLAFSGAPAIVKGSDILHFVAFMNPDGTISESSRLTIDAYDTAYKAGGYSEKYLIVGAGSDTYVVADTDGVRGYDQVVLLKNVVSSLVTADMFMAL